METNPKKFVNSKSIDDSPLVSFKKYSERDDDDPISIRYSSLNFLGIILAALTILLPSISVFIGRPLSQENEIIHNHNFKKDGP